MADITKNLSINYLSTNMANKEVLINEGFLKVDSILNNGAKSKATVTPPITPSESDMYIIPASATGDWATHTNKITYYNPAKGWVKLVANAGMLIWVVDESKLYAFDGTNWVIAANIETQSKFGINATADTTNRLLVKSDAVLFDNNGTNSQVKVNKYSASNTASHLFQTNFSGRAEFGLTGDDDFHVKVSPDGSTWNESLVIDKTTGVLKNKKRIDADAGISFDSGTNILQNYVAGSFTPTLYGTSTAGTPTYTNQTGSYVRIGAVFFYWIRLDITARGGISGSVRVGGLPYTIAGSNMTIAGPSISMYTNANLGSNFGLTATHVASGSADISLRTFNATTCSTLTESQITDTFTLRMSGVARL